MKYSARKQREFGSAAPPRKEDIATNHTQHISIGRVPVSTPANEPMMIRRLDWISGLAFAALAFVTTVWFFIASVMLT